MGDGEPDTDREATETDEEDSQEVSVTFDREYIEEQLMPQYPAALHPAHAIRMAVANDVERKQESITPARIRDSVIEALERAGGGSFENVQRIVVGDVDELEIEDVGDVQVIEGNSEET